MSAILLSICYYDLHCILLAYVTDTPVNNDRATCMYCTGWYLKVKLELKVYDIITFIMFILVYKCKT